MLEKSADIDFILLGCDGIFDQLEDNEVLQSVWSSLKDPLTKKSNLHLQCGMVVEMVIKGALVRNSLDNLTAILICFDNFEKIFNGQITTIISHKKKEKKIENSIILSPIKLNFKSSKFKFSDKSQIKNSTTSIFSPSSSTQAESENKQKLYKEDKLIIKNTGSNNEINEAFKVTNTKSTKPGLKFPNINLSMNNLKYLKTEPDQSTPTQFNSNRAINKVYDATLGTIEEIERKDKLFNHGDRMEMSHRNLMSFYIKNGSSNNYN